MSATSPRLEARSRWSQAVKCARQGAYGLLGVDPAEPDERTQRLWIRGRQLGAYVADSFAAKYGEDGIIREKAIPWPAGILHSDAFVIPEKVAVEVKSSTSPNSILDAALLQLAGEVHFDPDAESGLLAIVNPSDLGMEFVPFVLTDEWIERVETVADEVMRAGASSGLALPERVCHKPGDGVGRFCPFISHCFDGWEPEPLAELDDPDTLQLVRELDDLKRRYREHNGTADGLRDEYKEIEARLTERGLEAGRTYQVGGFQVRRIVARGRETFQLSRARKSGFWTSADDERLAAFLRFGDPSERYDVQRAGEAADVDYGDDPPF